MATKFISEATGKFGNFRTSTTSPAELDMAGVTELLTETDNMLKTTGFDIEAPDAMRSIYTDSSVARTYIDGLSEGLEGEDAKLFRTLSENMLDAIVGRGQFANKGYLPLLEDNVSAGFMVRL